MKEGTVLGQGLDGSSAVVAAGGALCELVVVDLTTGLSGAYAGKLLADLGSRVVMVEPPSGSPLRTRPPLAPDGSSTLFAHMSGGKESVLLTGSNADEVLERLVWSANVVLVDGTSPWQAHLPAPLPEHVVRVDLSPWGRSGPYACWRGSDIAVWAMGGYLYFTGSPDREPVYLPGGQAELHAGAHAAFAALVGVHEHRRSKLAQSIEVSHLESVLVAHAWLVSSWAACGAVLRRVPMDLIRASDGWVYAMRIVPYPDLFMMIERPDMGEEGLTDDLAVWHANIPRIFEAVGEWAKDKTVDEIIEFSQALRIAVTPVLDAKGVVDDPQVAARRWWERTEGDTMTFPGQPFHLSASPAGRRGSAPSVGADTESVMASLPARGHLPARPVAANVAEPPLAGLKVLELTANWAGPVCGRFFADLGADVIKVEWPVRPATRALFWVGPEQDFQRQPHHRAMYFNEMNRNKRDVAIDISTEDGKEIVFDLVRRSDVLIENYSARVMPNFGLGWEQLREVNPRLIMLSMSGYGADGPRRDWSAYGSNIETTSGLTSVTGYPDGVMSRTTLYYADPVSGVLGAVAVMAALEHRRRTGEGQWIEMALNECGAAFMAEPLLDYLANGVIRRPMGNRDRRFAPQGVYPNAGTDHWVAISVQDDDDWVRLAEAMGRPDLANDPELATVEGRWARHDELDEMIGAWTATLEQYEVAWELQRRGVSAAPVLANWQVLPDPHIYHSGFYQNIEHPVVGVYPTATYPWRFSRTGGRLDRPGPLFAEHNRQIFEDLGYDDERIAQLYERRVTSDEPFPPE